MLEPQGYRALTEGDTIPKGTRAQRSSQSTSLSSAEGRPKDVSQKITQREPVPPELTSALVIGGLCGRLPLTNSLADPPKSLGASFVELAKRMLSPEHGDRRS